MTTPRRTSPVSSAAEHIAASRRRSKLYGIDPSTPGLPFHGDPAPSAAVLTKLSDPLLGRLVSDITDTSIAVVLADSAGTVAYRNAGRRHSLGAMDGRAIEVGFSLAESDVGTNGVGTSLEARRPTMVIGEDHYLHSLKAFTCAYAPIRHPVTGRIAGTIGMMCPVEETSPLLLPMATRLAEEITDVLLGQATPDERQLLEVFLRHRRRAADAVATLNERVFIGTPAARRELTDVGQHELWDRVSLALRSGGSGIAEVPRPDAPPLLLRCKPVIVGGSVDGAIVEVVATPSRLRQRTRPVGTSLGSLVGTGEAWLEAVRQSTLAARSGEPCVVIGERGTGRRSVAEAIIKMGQASRLTVIDADERLLAGDQAWTARCQAVLVGHGRGPEGESPPTTEGVILHHLDHLPPDVAAALSMLLDRSSPDVRVIGTTSDAAPSEPAAASLLDRLAIVRVLLPPLRARRGDIAGLVRDIAGRLGHRQVPSAVVDVLRQYSWPGNVTELRQVLRAAAAASEGQRLAVRDLPVRVRVPPVRKALGGLREQEAHAIIAAVAAADGNKSKAAESLGISRATLYRRIDSYGLGQAL